MIIVGSDSHTCTVGAFNALAVGVDRTEAAGLWKRSETWFWVSESIKITLKGNLPEDVYAKDLSLWIIGMIGSVGVNYMSIEYHGDRVKTLSISGCMTLVNLASEMGAENAIFPPDKVLEEFYGQKVKGIWADEGARYFKEYEINVSDFVPLVAAPHHVDNVKSMSEVKGVKLNQGLNRNLYKWTIGGFANCSQNIGWKTNCGRISVASGSSFQRNIFRCHRGGNHHQIDKSRCYYFRFVLWIMLGNQMRNFC